MTKTMIEPLNPTNIRKAITNKQPVLGTLVWEIATPAAAWALKRAGYDFCWIDTEHSEHSFETIAAFMRTAHDAQLPTFVRVPAAEYHLIARTLDCGADGIIVPRIECRAEAEKVVMACRYPPVGKRGFGLHALVCDRFDLPLHERLTRQNDRTIIIIQVETASGMENLESIISVPGVDVVMVGPADLSISLGIPGEFEHPRVLAAIDRIVALAATYGYAVGYHHDDPSLAKRAAERGCTVVSVGNDVLFLENGARSALATINSPCSDNASPRSPKRIWPA